jgi:hypothetical protein
VVVTIMLVWALRPRTGWWCAPSGPIASKVSGGAVPVIRQTIFSEERAAAAQYPAGRLP